MCETVRLSTTPALPGTTANLPPSANVKHSHIEWTTHTFNPWIGCTKVSPGCLHCYAEARDQRFAGGSHWGTGSPRHRTATWAEPRRWDRAAARPAPPRPGDRPKVFCASLGDWLDDEVPAGWLADLLGLVLATPHLNWQLLTKRPRNFRARLSAALPLVGEAAARRQVEEWLAGRAPGHVWLGTTVEDQRRAEERIPLLCALPAIVRFLSVEPLLEAIDLQATAAGPRPDLQWVIAGGESGHGARPMAAAWVRSLRDQCAALDVPFFFKQWGCHDESGRPCSKKAGGRLLDGQTHDGWPRGFEPLAAAA